MANLTHDPQKTILIVEDSRLFSRALKSRIESDTPFKAIVVETHKELTLLLESTQQPFFASLLDLHLADAPNGEIIDYVLSYNIPAIVFTGSVDNDDVRDRMFYKGVVDYVYKESPANIEYIISLLKQLARNIQLKVLIVDDSKTARNHLRRLLNIYLFKVIEAENGEQALAILEKTKEITLVITDFNMPKMDGIELTTKIRKMYSKKELAIIGISTYGNHSLSARFLKTGGNDFIHKPFLEEEFFCRINQNMELLEHIKNLDYIATRDYLTGLYNRRYFFEKGKKIFNKASIAQRNITLALMDVDFFKQINDAHGHEVGDDVLRRLGEILIDSVAQGNIVARFGGEEFCFLLVDMNATEALKLFEELCNKISLQNLSAKQKLTITVSIGICASREINLETALSKADKALYLAKKKGRNQIVLH